MKRKKNSIDEPTVKKEESENNFKVYCANCSSTGMISTFDKNLNYLCNACDGKGYINLKYKIME